MRMALIRWAGWCRPPMATSTAQPPKAASAAREPSSKSRPTGGSPRWSGLTARMAPTPQGALIQARDGSFYGTAEFGHTGYNGASGSGDGLVFRLTLPLFLSNPFTQASAIAMAPYSASLSTNAVTPTGDVLTLAKVSGPAWLSVATDGTLSGTPAVADIGANMFTVSLADTNGWSS